MPQLRDLAGQMIAQRRADREQRKQLILRSAISEQQAIEDDKRARARAEEEAFRQFGLRFFNDPAAANQGVQTAGRMTPEERDRFFGGTFANQDWASLTPLFNYSDQEQAARFGDIVAGRGTGSEDIISPIEAGLRYDALAPTGGEADRRPMSEQELQDAIAYESAARLQRESAKARSQFTEYDPNRNQLGRQMPDGTFVPTAPTPEQEAANQRQILQGTELHPDIMSGRAQAAGMEAGAEADARNRSNLRFLPQQMEAQFQLWKRQKEAEISITRDVEAAEAYRVSVANMAQLLPSFHKIVDLASGINTYEGGWSRIYGGIAAGEAAMGLRPDVVLLEQEINKIFRPVAVGLGIREAQVSNFEQELVLRGINISAWNSIEETNNSIQNLYDLITLGPVVKRKLAEMGLTDNAAAAADMVVQLIGVRKQKRAEAEAGGFDAWYDEELGQWVPVHTGKGGGQ